MFNLNNVNFRQQNRISPLNKQNMTFKGEFTMPDGVKVHDATKNDAYGISRLFLNIMVDDYNQKEWADESLIKYNGDLIRKDIENGSIAHVIKDNKGKIIASATLSPLNSKIGIIDGIFVHKKIRGKGYGNELAKKLIQDAKKAGCEKIVLWTINPIAEKMYKNLKFVEIPKEKLGKLIKNMEFPDDAIWMELNLNSINTIA